MRAIRYHDEARLELIHEVGYYTAVSARLGERFWNQRDRRRTNFVSADKLLESLRKYG